ncbi:MAG: DUF362 domain-containing protein [Planctomycetota bacterium]
MASTVHFTPLHAEESDASIARKTQELYDAAGLGQLVSPGQMLAIKTHFGEKGNEYYVPLEFMQPVIDSIRREGGKPFFVETSALYTGQRSNAVDHFRTAMSHGFDPAESGCPLIFVDGLKGNYHVEVEVGLKHFETVAVAGDFTLVPSALIVTHATGHDLAGFGGAIKNVAMGLASRAGKLRQHDAGKPEVKTEKCIACGTCARYCPVDAIEIRDTATIDKTTCIGCGQCLAVCPEDAIGFSWSEGPESFNEKMAEFAYGIMKGHRGETGYLTYIWHVTDDCNCAGKTMDYMCPDIGIVASKDPVALDQATVDLINETEGRDVISERWPESHYEAQLSHGEEVGLGERRYELIKV